MFFLPDFINILRMPLWFMASTDRDTTIILMLRVSEGRLCLPSSQTLFLQLELNCGQVA